MSAVLPRVRAGVVVRRTGDDAIVYDSANDQVLAVSPLGASVLEACDGRTALEDFAKANCLHPAELAPVLDELTELGLIEAATEPGSWTRRSLFQRSAVIGGGVIVASIAAPMAAAHATGELGQSGTGTYSNYQGPYAYGVYNYYSSNPRTLFYAGSGTLVSLTPGDVITGFDFEQIPASSYDFGDSNEITFGITDGDTFATSASGVVDTVKAVVAPPVAGADSAFGVRGFNHIVSDTGDVVLCAYAQVVGTQRLVQLVVTTDGSGQAFTGNSSTVGHTLQYTVYGYPAGSPGATSKTSSHESDSRRSDLELPSPGVLAKQGRTGIPLPGRKGFQLKPKHRAGNMRRVTGSGKGKR